MSNYANLKNAIQSVIKTNGNNEITGQLLQNELLAMITALGYGYQFMGVANPEKVPGTPDAKVFYIAYSPGTYTNFDGIVVSGLCVLKYDSSWTKEDIPVSGGGASFSTNEEDLLLSNSVLQFASRIYPANTSGKSYVIVRRGTSLATQISVSNAIYEIRDDFNLNGGTLTLPSDIILRFNGGKIRNGTINFGNALIDADNVVVLDGITVANCTSNQKVNTIWFGMIPGNSDNSQILQMLVDNFVSVFVNDGEYTCLSEIVIASTSRILYLSSKKVLLTNYTTRLRFPQSNGLVVRKRIEISGLHITGVLGTFNSETGMYEGGYIGIDCRTACIIKDASVASFDIGIDTENGLLVTAIFENVVIQYCGNVGFNFVSAGNYVNNNCTIRKIYCVKVGHNADKNTDPSTERISGHGMVILGGNGNTICDSVFEYNTGCGVYIKAPTDQSVLRGLVIIGNYFEHNKYANLFVNFSTSSPARFGNTIIKGNLYTDANLPLPSNILQNRSCSVIDDFGTMYRDNAILEKADKSIYQKYGEGAPLWDSDMMVAYNTDMNYYDKASGGFIFDSSKVASPYIYLQFLRATLKRGVYRLLAYCKSSGANDRVMNSAMYINGQRITNSQTIFRNWNTFDFHSISPYFFIPDDGGTFTMDTLQMSSLASGDTVEVQKLILRKYDALTTAQIESIITSPWLGMTIFDSTRGKEILWNGTAWVNMDGTPLTA